MAKAAPIQTSFNGGIQTPLLDGYINAPRREASYKDSTNLIPLKHGPLVRRGGTKYSTEVRDSDKRSDLWPFEYNDEQSYIVEASADGNYGTVLRYFQNNSLVTRNQKTIVSIASGADPLVTISGSISVRSQYDTDVIVYIDGVSGETSLNGNVFRVKAWASSTTFTLKHYDGSTLTTSTSSTGGTISRAYNNVLPYCGTELFDSNNVLVPDKVQSNDVVFIAHQNYTPRVLSRTSSDPTFEVNKISFVNGPYLEENVTDTTVTVTGSGPYTITASSAIFDRKDTTYTATITSISAANPAVVTMPATTAGVDIINGDKVIFTGTATGAGWEFLNRPYTVSNIAIGANTTFNLVDCDGNTVDSSGYSGAGGTFTLTRGESDRLLRIWDDNANGGDGAWRWGRITDYTSTTVVEMTIDADSRDFPGTLPSNQDRWALGRYSDTTGYPSVITIHEGRLVLGGGAYPRHLDFTRTGGFSPTEFNFRPTQNDDSVLDDLAISIDIGGGDGSPIQWIHPVRGGLAVGTTSKEGLVSSSSNTEALTPGNASYKVHSSVGSASIQPIEVGSSLIYVQRVRRRLMEFGYSLDQDGYAGFDATELAEHLTRSGVIDIAFQQEPIQTIWCVMTDGSLVAFTFDKGSDVIAGHRHIIGGDDVSVDGIAVIPSSDISRDELWLVVGRTLNARVGGGTETRKYIEYMTRWYEDDIGQNEAYHVDGGKFYTNPIVAIEGVTKADPAVVTLTSHTLSDGDVIIFEGVSGMTELNDKYFKVANSTSNTFELNWLDNTTVDSTAYGTWASATSSGYRLCANTFSALQHLSGETVQVYADGRWLTNKTVDSDGVVTLGTNQYGARVSIGLPYTWTLETHRIEAGAADGTAQGKIKRIEEVIVRLRDTLGLKYGGSSSDLYDDPATNGANASAKTPLFTGDTVLTWPDGYGREGYMYFKGEGPFPAQIQAIMPKVTTND